MEFVIEEFIKAMSDIGRYGFEKYGTNSFQQRAVNGDTSRYGERTETKGIIKHAKDHADSYERGELHDHFGTLTHQLAAGAFNLMMEFYFAKLAEKEHVSN